MPLREALFIRLRVSSKQRDLASPLAAAVDRGKRNLRLGCGTAVSLRRATTPGQARLDGGRGRIASYFRWEAELVDAPAFDLLGCVRRALVTRVECSD
jgi:hypothetical protein